MTRKSGVSNPHSNKPAGPVGAASPILAPILLLTTELENSMNQLLNGVAVSCWQQRLSPYGRSDTISAETNIQVRTNEPIDTRNAGDGRIFTGVAEREVLDTNSRVAIPRG